MKNITEMEREDLLGLAPADVDRTFTADEVVHIARTLGAFWTYDYGAADKGRVGMHALLKSGKHSDGFFVSRILLEPENIRHIMAEQIVMQLRAANISDIDYAAGVPDGATELGKVIIKLLGVTEAKFQKSDGRIVLGTEIPNGARLLLVEDFCTRGTGFSEAVSDVKSKNPSVNFVPYDPVIINRGGISAFSVDGVGCFTVLPVVTRRINDWNPNECILCYQGSKVIKPKATDEDWRRLTTSQQ